MLWYRARHQKSSRRGQEPTCNFNTGRAFGQNVFNQDSSKPCDHVAWPSTALCYIRLATPALLYWLGGELPCILVISEAALAPVVMAHIRASRTKLNSKENFKCKFLVNSALKSESWVTKTHCVHFRCQNLRSRLLAQPPQTAFRAASATSPTTKK